jgi:LacI family transcriptional regulator
MPLISENSSFGRGELIAMLVDHVSDPFFAGLARRIDRRARSLGYKLVFGSTENDTSFMPKLIAVFKNMNVAGYIIAPPEGVEPDLRKLIQRDSPVVLFDRFTPDPGPYSILADNFKGAYDAITHLVQTGCRHIALMTVSSMQKRVVDRRKGYEAAIDNHSLPASVVELSASASIDEVRTAIRSLLKANRNLDALVFADSSLGVTIPGILKEYKKSIPDDLSVIGFDDNENFQFFAPAVTAVVQPLDEIVENIFQCICGHSRERSATQRRSPIVLPTRMVIRSSTLKTKTVAPLVVTDNQ